MNAILVSLGFVFLAGCLIACHSLISSWPPQGLRAIKSTRQLSIQYRIHRKVSMRRFKPPADTDWAKIVSDILGRERCTFDVLLRGGKLGPDLLANAVNAWCYLPENVDRFAVLRVHHLDHSDAEICGAMQAAARLIRAAITISYGQAVVVDTEVKERLSLLSNHQYFSEGFVPNPALRQFLSERAPGYSDASYAQAIDYLLSKYKQYWALKTFKF